MGFKNMAKMEDYRVFVHVQWTPLKAATLDGLKYLYSKVSI